MSQVERGNHFLAFSQLVLKQIRLHTVNLQSSNTTGGPTAEKEEEAAACAAPEGDR